MIRRKPAALDCFVPHSRAVAPLRFYSCVLRMPFPFLKKGRFCGGSVEVFQFPRDCGGSVNASWRLWSQRTSFYVSTVSLRRFCGGSAQNHNSLGKNEKAIPGRFCGGSVVNNLHLRLQYQIKYTKRFTKNLIGVACPLLIPVLLESLTRRRAAIDRIDRVDSVSFAFLGGQFFFSRY